MAGRADILAGRAYVELLLKDSGFSRGVDAAGAKLKSAGRAFAIVGAAIAGAGAAIVTPLLAMTRQFAEAGSELFDMSKRTNESVESLHFLKYAAGETGTEIEKIQQAMFFALKDGKNFDEVAAHIAAIKDPAKQAQAALESFGKRSGAFLLPMLRQLPQLREEYARLGLGMSTQTASSARALETSFYNLSAVIKSTRNAIGGALAPTVREAVDWITNVAVSVRGWVRANSELFVSALRVGVVLIGVGTAIAGFGGILAASGFALIGINAALGLMAGLFGALISPIGLAVGAVAGLATWFATSTTWGRQMVTSLAGWFGELRDIAVEAFGGIADAIASGDLQLAFQVAMAGIKYGFLTATQDMHNWWIDFKYQYLSVTTEIVYGAARLWEGLVANLKSLWAGLVTNSESVGEQIGHYLSRSNDPQLRADQDAAHNVALQNIQKEGQARQQQITNERDARLKALQNEQQGGVFERQQAQIKEQNKLVEEANRAQQQLDGLREKAAKERKEHDLKIGPKFDPANFNLNSDMLKQQIFGSFSAAALTAGGGSADPPDVKAIREGNKQRQILLKEARDTRIAAEKLNLSLTAHV